MIDTMKWGTRRARAVWSRAVLCALVAALAPWAAAQAPGSALSHQEISQLAGSFGGELDDGDGFGYATASLGDLNGDGVGDLAVGAWGDDDGGLDRGAVWILFLDEQGRVRGQQKISQLAGGFTGALDDDDRFGYSLAGLGDHDGDGVPDLAVGAIFDDDGGFAHGAVWILFLNPNGTVKAQQKISDTEGGFEGELHYRDYLGASLGFLGDHDGDGIGDIASGAYRDGEGEFGTEGGEGAVWILFLNADGSVKSHAKIASQVGGLTAFLGHRDNFGRAVASIGDLDRDGVGDLAVGAPLSKDLEDSYWGVVWILFLNLDGSVKAYQRLSPLDGGLAGAQLDNRDRFGFALADLGDVNGDGTRDLAVGAPQDDDGGSGELANRGAVWILFMNQDGSVRGTNKLSASSGSFGAPLADGDLFGHSLAALVDHDGDGRVELAAGAAFTDAGGPDRGAMYYIDLVAAATAQWSDAGHSLQGSGPVAPVLVGTGALVGGADLILKGFHAGPVGSANAVSLFTSFETGFAPFKGGVLVPAPHGLGGDELSALTDLGARFTILTRWPVGLSTGQRVHYQAWIVDPAGPQGFAASNALYGTEP